MSVGEAVLAGVALVGVVVALVLATRGRGGSSAAAEEAARAAAERERLDVLRQALIDREEKLTDDLRRAREQEAELRTREETQSRAEADRVAAARAELERIAGLSAEQARQEVLGSVEKEASRAAAILLRDREAETKSTADARAREILGIALQRVSSEQTVESVVVVVHLAQDDLKGRIIGREGRNIRTFEAVTGVNLLIDDTPDAVVLSSFDPMRREIARHTLEALLADGRIHPQRIEEQHALAVAAVDTITREAADDALAQVGIDDLHPELTRLLGRLRFRTSYGQNVLRHLVETAHIAGALAGELGLSRPAVASVKRGAFLHDIGKAVTAEVEGSHALVGAELARRYGESADVVHAIEAHHEEVAPHSLEAWLTIASDSCSGGRPGARREAPGSFATRMEAIEKLAGSHPGVERVFAMSAGREVRVMVLPDQVDDVGARVLAGDIARQIEAELTYPGEIHVTVVRESRATDTAH